MSFFSHNYVKYLTKPCHNDIILLVVVEKGANDLLDSALAGVRQGSGFVGGGDCLEPLSQIGYAGVALEMDDRILRACLLHNPA
jgi:hypothetical protein